jgi:hypothetical protein
LRFDDDIAAADADLFAAAEVAVASLAAAAAAELFAAAAAAAAAAEAAAAAAAAAARFLDSTVRVSRSRVSSRRSLVVSTLAFLLFSIRLLSNCCVVWFAVLLAFCVVVVVASLTLFK